jgi:hypothetical protein
MSFEGQKSQAQSPRSTMDRQAQLLQGLQHLHALSKPKGKNIRIGFFGLCVGYLPCADEEFLAPLRARGSWKLVMVLGRLDEKLYAGLTSLVDQAYVQVREVELRVRPGEYLEQSPGAARSSHQLYAK